MPTAELANTTRPDSLAADIVADRRRHVRTLLRRGVSPDTLVWNWDSALFLAVCLRRVAITHMLLRAGAKPRAQTGRSPLVASVAHNLPALTRALLDRGADPNENDVVHEITALELAVLENRARVVDLLCAAGADPSRPMRRFPSLGHWPVQLPNAWSRMEFLHRVRHRRALLARPEWRGADIPRVHLSRATPLPLVALGCRAERCAEILLTHGAKRTALDSAGHGWDDYVAANEHSCATAPHH